MRFTKMQGAGNDYIYVNTLEETVRDPSGLARVICRRHYGVGSDGLILIGRGRAADFSMRIFNPDGSESEMCGNGARCVGRYVYERGLTDRTEFTLETGGGIRVIRLDAEGGRVASVRVDMGSPVLDPGEIPVAAEGGTALGLPLSAGGRTFEINCVSMGNPHCVLFVPDAGAADVETVGPLLERDPFFPQRTNVEFAEVVDRGHLRVRVWERGVGETLACGTGACAALAAAFLTGRAEREADVDLPGGRLHLVWSEADGRICQQGPAEFVYDGVWPD